MRTITCERIIAHPDGVVEVQYADTSRNPVSLTFVNSKAFSEWLEAVEASLSGEHLLAMALMPSYRGGKVAGLDTAYNNSKAVADMKVSNPGISITVSL